jgi:hypothetical protein
MITIKELKSSIPDRILDVYTEGRVTVITFPSGRLKIMPKDRKPKIRYSLRNGGRKHNGGKKRG